MCKGEQVVIDLIDDVVVVVVVKANKKLNGMGHDGMLWGSTCML